MAFRIHDSVVRGEIDNREKGVVRGRLWVDGRAEPVELELRGNAHPDLAGCRLTFTNPLPTLAHPHLDSLHRLQHGTIGDLTASRKVRVFDIPLPEALDRIRRGEKPPEHTANSLYLEWYSEANGRVVIESADYHLEISPPAWRLTPAEEEQRAADAAAGFTGFLGKLSEALEAARGPTPDDRPMDEFEWEQAFRESDALTAKARELEEKFGDRPDFEEILAREMGWDEESPADDELAGKDVAGLDVDEANRLCAEAGDYPPEPNPLTEGVDWVRDEQGQAIHPLQLRIREGWLALWSWCEERQLLGERGDTDLQDLLFSYQSCGTKCAGALARLPYNGPAPEPGFIVAGLKRALARLHETLEAVERVAARSALPPDKLEPLRRELFGVRENILALMKRFRDEAA